MNHQQAKIYTEKLQLDPLLLTDKNNMYNCFLSTFNKHHNNVHHNNNVYMYVKITQLKHT